jgi:hypothetical protein
MGMHSAMSFGDRLVMILKEYIDYDLAYIRNTGICSDIQHLALQSRG